MAKEYNRKLLENARNLFLLKGIINREIVRNEIAISWSRSQVYGILNNNYEINKNFSLKEISMDIDDINKEFHNIISILAIDQFGKPFINFYSNFTEKNFFEINYSISSIGTNGIGMAIINQKSFWTNGYENYNDFLCDYNLTGIPLNGKNGNYTIGFIFSDLEIINEKNIKKLEKKAEDLYKLIPINESTNKESNYEKNETSNLYEFSNYFSGQSFLSIEFMEKFNSLKLINSNIFIEGDKGTGKEILARLFHKESRNSNKEFLTIYCDKIPEEVFINKYIDKLLEKKLDDIGLIYFESFESLSYKSQEKLIRLLESKPIYKDSDLSSYTNNYRCIFSSVKSLDSLKKSELISNKLISRVKVISIKIPSVDSIKDDLQEIIEMRIKKFAKKYYLPNIKFSSELIDKMCSKKWLGNYRELDKAIEGIFQSARHESVIGIEYFYKIFPEYKKSKPLLEVETLEITEKIAIEKALEIYNYNMARTSKKLGISRSTLYRKIDKYNISI